MSEVKYASGWIHPDDADKLQKQNQALVEALKDKEMENGQMREALKRIAEQEMIDEMESPEYVKNADYEGAYETMIKRAREAIQGEPI